MTNRNRVHYSTEKPGQTGKARARCGVWSSAFTTDRNLVTCLACRNLIRTIAKTASLVLSFALMLAACGPLPPDDQASDTGTTYVTSGAEGTTTPFSTSTGTPDTTGTTGPAESTTGTTGGTSEDTAATGTETSTGTPDEATGGETGESQTTGACSEPACIAADCDVGQECRPHPGTGTPVCVSPCEPVGAGLCEAMACGEPALGLCVADPLGVAWCFPGVTGS